jgi:hypothetical protein
MDGGRAGRAVLRLNEPYLEGARSWRKYKARITTEAIIGAVTDPRTLLLGRYDPEGRLQYTGRSTTLFQTARRTLADRLAAPAGAHPWTGWTFSTGWGTQRTLDVHLMEPDVVLEVAVDVARDASGSWRHPARLHRVCTDVDGRCSARAASPLHEWGERICNRVVRTAGGSPCPGSGASTADCAFRLERRLFRILEPRSRIHVEVVR